MKELSLQEIQAESLNILKDVHKFCVSCGIIYSVAYGTLIGAIRHKGFIPWDDDIDIIMPRSDYDRFCQNYVSSRYKLGCPDQNNDYYLAFARVYDDIKTTSRTFVPWHDEESGIWIDVFPADSVIDDQIEFEKHKASLQRKWARIAWGRWAKHGFIRGCGWQYYLKLLVKKALTFNGMLARSFLDSFIRSTDQVKTANSDHWSQLACLDGYEWHKSVDFKETVLMPFEDTEVMVMNGWDNVLRESYGDYMELPPVDKRVGHSVSLTKFYWK